MKHASMVFRRPPVRSMAFALTLLAGLPALAGEPRWPQPAPAPRRHVAASNRVYTRREGETIAIVAKKLHLPEEDILAVNPGINTRRLSIGQTLRLPRRHK